MPKKATRHGHVRESASSATASTTTTAATTAVIQEKTKRHRSVHIGPRNGRRWLSLKKRLGLSTDDDLIVYLLDLADSIVARDENYHENAEPCKMRMQGKELLDVTETSSPVHNVFQMELPRRSLRKLANSEESPKSEKSDKTEKLASFSNNLDKINQQESKLYSKSYSRTSKTKRHKSKARHHKEKRKKRKHQKIKDLKDLMTIENRISNNTSWEFDSEIDGEKCPTDLQDNFISQSVPHQSSKELNSLDSEKSIAVQNLCHNKNQEIFSDLKKTDISNDQNNISANYAQEQIEDDTVQNSSMQDIEMKINSDDNKYLVNSCKLSQPIHTHSTRSLSSQQEIKNTQYLDNENSNKRRKRSKHESNESCITLVEKKTDNCDELTSPLHKRDKKRHKGAEHQSKKHRDVRKAPQDGIIETDKNQDLTSCSNDLLPITATAINVPDNKPSLEAIIENIESEPPRLAIKIKLCQECNSRHLEDACPLTEPEYTIKDSISLEQWVQKHNKNTEAMKAFHSNDPMSQGYKKHSDDSFESDEESSEQYKSKSKTECEEKQEIIDANRPLFARDSLPDCLEFKLSNMDHGLGVYVKNLIPMYAQLGPLIGKPVQEMDIPDDFPMRHIWEIEDNNKTLYISTTNPLTSNWIRYIRPAETKEDRNVAVISKNGELFLVTSKSLTVGTELTYWSDSQSTAWTRKNKIDKTNCGGCNLNFAHPIYYRLHCCIFHDTNYSLTIRKYHCKVCGAAVLGKDNIMKHAAQLHAGRGAYQCQYCKKFFLRLNYLEMHRTYGCSQNPQRSRPLCDFCGRKFCQPQKLKVHIKRMHSDMSEVLREFQCKMCLKLLGSRAALQRHMKEVHHKDVVGAATCDRCGKMFQNKSNLKIHMLTHSGVKPFKCKENGCKAAFTTKQCLQFHYKKVHGLSEDLMPKIERSVAYTFDAYSGGIVEDVGRGKTPKFNPNNTQENDSLASFDDCSSEHNNSQSVELSNIDSNKQMKVTEETSQQEMPITGITGTDSALESAESDVDLYGTPRTTRKSSKKWLSEFDPGSNETPTNTGTSLTVPDVYDFEENRIREEEEELKNQESNQTLIDDSKLNNISVYRRTESANASLLVEAALDAAEREIGAVSSPILEDSDRETNLYSISNELDFKTSQNEIMHRPQSSPDNGQHLDSYMQNDLNNLSSVTNPHGRHTPPSHMQLDYHIHRPIDYVNSSSRATHNIEQYLDQQDIQRVIHTSHQVGSSTSPQRYQEVPHPHLHSHAHSHTHVLPPVPPPQPLPHLHHELPHSQIANDALDSDEGDSVAQNLSLSIKEKNLQQLELVKYDTNQTLENEFSIVNRERVRFEPLIIQPVADQGLDMSARGFQQTFGSQVQSSSHHHHHHLYEMSERERQGVDLSRTACMSPPPYPPPYTPPYTHVDVPRVVSLESTSRSHHLHNSVSRIITSPQPASSLTSHLVPESLEARILSSPPPSMAAYNTSYPVGPSPYHTSRSGYHYPGYY